MTEYTVTHNRPAIKRGDTLKLLRVRLMMDGEPIVPVSVCAQIRTAPSEEFDVYNEHAEACRQWGREQKVLLGL